MEVSGATCWLSTTVAQPDNTSPLAAVAPRLRKCRRETDVRLFMVVAFLLAIGHQNPLLARQAVARSQQLPVKALRQRCPPISAMIGRSSPADYRGGGTSAAMKPEGNARPGSSTGERSVSGISATCHAASQLQMSSHSAELSGATLSDRSSTLCAPSSMKVETIGSGIASARTTGTAEYKPRKRHKIRATSDRIMAGRRQKTMFDDTPDRQGTDLRCSVLRARRGQHYCRGSASRYVLFDQPPRTRQRGLQRSRHDSRQLRRRLKQAHALERPRSSYLPAPY